MNYILFDNNERSNLLPLVFTRPVADIRIGIMTIREKWEWYLGSETSSLTQDYLAEKYPLKAADDNLLIDGSILPNKDLVDDLLGLHPNEYLEGEGLVIGMRIKGDLPENLDVSGMSPIHTNTGYVRVKDTWDIFSKNDQAIRDDFQLLTEGRKSAPVSQTNFILGPADQIFLEEGATVEYAFLNAQDGPIYIGKDALVMEGSKIRGAFALCANSILKLDAKIYSGTTIGPHCKVGGEVQNVVFFGFSNKGHDGYLGNAVVGEWCNFGADTNNSNLKNTYDIVKLWSYPERRFKSTGLQFCGLIMGDHSKTGINTMFNTGTVVGVSCNLFGSGYQRNFIPSFSWGGPHGLIAFNMKKSFDVARAVMKRRGLEFDETEEAIFSHIYALEQT